MPDTFLTVIVRNPTPSDIEELCFHPRLSATSWSHAIDERDELKWRLQKLLNERSGNG
jgi:hypothetical protein